MAKSKRAMEELLKALNKNANEVGLSINQENTKYLEVNTKRSNINRSKNVNIRQRDYERVQTFNFLGSVINDKNVYCAEIFTRIKKGNKAFFMNKKLLSSELNGKESKMKTYIYIHYKAHCKICLWNLDLDGEGYELFNDIRKKNPEKSIGSIQERDRWRIRTNYELNKSIGGAHIVRFIKAQRLKWWGHIHRMEECRMVRRILVWIPVGKWSRGYRIYDGLKSRRILEYWVWNIGQRWMDRLALHDLVEKSKPYGGL